MLTDEVKKCMEESVLCWLATVDDTDMPNVSPKEMFTYSDVGTILIAHIASPTTLANIQHNPNVCVSFVHIFKQKGYKVKGQAQLFLPDHEDFGQKAQPLIDLYAAEYAIKAMIEIHIQSIAPIFAPSYFLHPDRTEQQHIDNTMKILGTTYVGIDGNKLYLRQVSIIIE